MESGRRMSIATIFNGPLVGINCSGVVAFPMDYFGGIRYNPLHSCERYLPRVANSIRIALSRTHAFLLAFCPILDNARDIEGTVVVM